ncbi:cellulase family protein [Diaporthe amygdali]|uniref:cellulase family protein n=1 Tax=Phomopsis amygdali TaxID=1214568 RepID=UPI0022FEC1E1|nr:cellulase family protein [Diaporthe amygdali]KAJ0118299.1 cellulase family protein [Diaporthe amygdali]
MALLLPLLLAFLALVNSAFAAPNVPLSTSSRWIVDAGGERVKLRCVNWAGHMETHLPEGLHKQSISYLADWIAGQGFNCVRLTYSIDWALNPTLPVADAFTQAATAAGVSADSMTSFYSEALAKNPFLQNATTQDVFGEVIDQLWARGVMTILDNHLSKASWCCNLTDGNGWWDEAEGHNDLNSRFFNTSQWLQGLAAVASWSASREGVVGLSLRNEIRQGLIQVTGIDDWYTLVTKGAQAVHSANPNALIIIGGIASATDLTTVRNRNLDTSSWSGKHVWEFHVYSFTPTFYVNFGICALRKEAWGLFDGFLLKQGEPYTAPLILSEFGVDMSGGDLDGLSEGDDSYLSCLTEYMTSNDADWAVWALQGTYYVRNGKTNYNETWGLLDEDWTTWRNSKFPGMLGKMWNVTQGPSQ